uniref:TM2 n=1 Tax=uncultured microorganism TaxID=358574 RepID=B1PLJ6_9ZZZZ|nr:TM2 [uncultured microorganism]
MIALQHINVIAMKRIVILFAAVALMATSLSAQVVPGMKYKDLKDIYNHKDYVKSSVDPYSKFWSGLASFAIPGLGQVICGETGRGLAIFGGDLALGLVNSVVADKYLSYAQKDASGEYIKGDDGWYVFTDEQAAKKWGRTLLGTVTATLVYDIWNICDARKVAKVKNMYYQDLQGRAVEFNLYPSVNYAMTSNGAQPVAGMTLSMQF